MSKMNSQGFSTDVSMSAQDEARALYYNFLHECAILRARSRAYTCSAPTAHNPPAASRTISAPATLQGQAPTSLAANRGQEKSLASGICLTTPSTLP